MLTPKQEKYVQNLVKGMSQRKAYKSSFDAKKMKDTTIDKKASELFQKEEIRGRYEELVKKLEDATIMNAKERMQWLTRVIKGEIKIIKENNDETREDEPYMGDRLKALDILNKMTGQYVEKVMNVQPPTIEDDV